MSKPFGSVWSLRTGAASRMDAAGNRTGVNGQGYQVGPGNQMTNDGTYSYHYDNEGNLIQRVTVAGGNTRDFTYDHRNRLTEVVDHLGSDAGPVTQDLKYDYDVFDRPVSRTLN
ncbi:MAG: RHS repeat protein, partial [Planctomycetia bacterium]|nr:RHS repeat protein [Planctomycetia bacterium]